MSTIKATMGEGAISAIITSPKSAFVCRHVSVPFTAITLSKDGLPFDNGQAWHRYQIDGNDYDEAGQNFLIKERTDVGFDGTVLTPHREFPQEAVTDLKMLMFDGRVNVARHDGKMVTQAKITKLLPEAQAIEIDYPAVDGDSGLLVSDMYGNPVGFVSAKIGTPGGPSTGAVVSVPPETPFETFEAQDLPAVQTQTPMGNAPQVLPTVVRSQEFITGVKFGQREALAVAKDVFTRCIDELLSQVK